MSGRALLRLALVTLVLLVVQSTLMLSIRIHGVHPDLLWLVPITAAILDGPETGAIAGFWSGLAFDLILPTPFGLSALVGCILGYAVGSATTIAEVSSASLAEHSESLHKNERALSMSAAAPGPSRPPFGDARRLRCCS